LYSGTLAIRFAAAWFGPSSIATVQLTLNCFELAAAGFVAGRSYRARPMTAVSLLAASLACIDFQGITPLGNFEPAMPLNISWLIRLTRDLLTDARFLDSWLATAGTDLLLAGSLIAGGMLSRPPEKPVSIAAGA
ncbi:MAG TPA: hypothetical protein VK419_08120, partial [Bryobacteraceae bacterium]|nr:hypothetical protein [Bryobacteraceae bacterium]